MNAMKTSSILPIPTVTPTPPEFQKVGAAGARTLWIVFVIMVLTSAIFAGLSWRVKVSKRLYHVVTTLITILAALSYFSMATGSGVSYHRTIIRESHRHGLPDTFKEINRQVYWARYVDWSLTTPLLLIDLGILAGLNGAHLTIAILADIIMVLTGLFAAFALSEGTKWGYFTIACIAYLVIIWHLAVNGRVTAKAKGSKVGNFFVAISTFTLVLWTLYPIVWGIADGARLVSVNTEIIAYAVLDILAKAGFGAWLLLTHARMPETGIEIGGFWSNGIGSDGALRLGDDDDGA